MHAVQMARYLFLIFTGGTAVKGYPDVEELALSKICQNPDEIFHNF